MYNPRDNRRMFKATKLLFSVTGQALDSHLRLQGLPYRLAKFLPAGISAAVCSEMAAPGAGDTMDMAGWEMVQTVSGTPRLKLLQHWEAPVTGLRSAQGSFTLVACSAMAALGAGDTMIMAG